MSLLAAAGIGAASGLLNTGLSLFGNKKSQKRAIAAQNALFEKQKDWEKEKMLNSYTWTMEDIEKAGLNPTLMMGDVGSANMAGSSTPGAVGTPSTPATAVSDAVSAMKISKELGLIDAQKQNIEADTDLKGSQTGKTQAEIEFQKTQNKYQENLLNLEVALKSETNRQIRANIEKTIEETSKIQYDIEKTTKEIDLLRSQGKIAEADAKTRVNNRRAYAILEMTESATRSVGNIMGAVKGTSAMPTTGNFNTNAVSWIR